MFKLQRICEKILAFSSFQLGIDPVKFFRFLARLPRYLRDLKHFKAASSKKMHLYPALHDRGMPAGGIDHEYFWQDLAVAQWIKKANPKLHVDIGSRIDGFVAQVASFRELEVFDIRPINVKIPGVTFRQVDLMCVFEDFQSCFGEGYCDSLSCLHTIEHFGLGRYGDLIDVKGYERGLFNLSQLLKSDGILYLSTPIGKERVEFNAHHVFDPLTIVDSARSYGLEIKKLFFVRGSRAPIEAIVHIDTYKALAKRDYSLGIFIFQKKGGMSDCY